MALPNLAEPFFRVSLLNSMVSTRGGGFRVAPPPACLGLEARKSPCGRSTATPKTPRESGFEKVLGSRRRCHFLSSRPRLVRCSREDGPRFAQAAPLPPAVHSLGKPGLKVEGHVLIGNAVALDNDERSRVEVSQNHHFHKLVAGIPALLFDRAPVGESPDSKR